jgi:hypothetical protein
MNDSAKPGVEAIYQMSEYIQGIIYINRFNGL